MAKPVAVITGDMHFTPATLELATNAYEDAATLALDLKVPLILNGDTLDTKAIIRAEVANRLIALTSESKSVGLRVIINTGNHDLLNEKGAESSLDFLRPFALVVSASTHIPYVGTIVPYFSDGIALSAELTALAQAGIKRLIIHQGVQTAFMGHYAQDKSSLSKESFADFRVIASHYHTRQDIICGPPKKGKVGTFSYIGNAYTLSFGEANDPEKGFQVLMDDGSLQFIPTNLRKHVIIACSVDALPLTSLAKPDDLVWIKLSGTRSELAAVDKKALGLKLLGYSNYKLDKIPTDAPKSTHKKPQDVTRSPETLDGIIDESNESAAQQAALKALWREALDENS